MNDTAPLPPNPPAWRPYAGPTAPAPQPPPPRGRRAAFVGSVLAASLLVGAGGGVGGAALWTNVLDDDEPASSPTSSTETTSPVVDAPDTPAPDGSVEAVAARVLPSVVKIDVAGSQGAGSGSGIILSSDGQILTNQHVVEVAAEGGSLTVSFDDGSHAEAEVVGTDPLTDTAVIQAQDVSGLTPATIGSSDDLSVGQEVVAVGSPFGLESTVTSGIVSALNRPVNVGSDGEGNDTVYPAIQTDAAINPGNSGGPLTDLDGNVVGINSSIRTAGAAMGQDAGSIGLGFAIPIDKVMPIVEQLANGEPATHARLGVSVSDVGGQPGVPGAESAPTGDGAQVQEVSPGSTAEEAGIEAGDVITQVDDHLVTSADSLVATIRSYRPGDTVTLTFERDGESQTAELTLDSDAEQPSS